MKTQITAFVIMLTLCFSACKKDGPSNDSILGKWRYSESLADPGDGSGKWKPVSDKSLYVEFKENGKLESNYFSTDTRYTLIDSVTVSLLKKDDTYQNYWYRIENNELIMSPRYPIMCIEGCGSKFKRTN